MKLRPGEKEATDTILKLCDQFGYGHFMSMMATAWARKMMKKWNMSETQAREGAFLEGYPFVIFDDLMERGEWDETGERYR